MISRRNIRVKVMQTLYSLESLEGSVKDGDPAKMLKRHFDQSRQLLVYLLYTITEVARYSETDARNKAAKHLPTAEDLHVNTKIAGNELMWKILEHPSYAQAVREEKPGNVMNPETLKSLYQYMTESEKYRQYIHIQARDKRGEKEMMEFILTDLLLPNESFISHLEENFSNWDDDAEMIPALAISFLAKPAGFNFQELISREKWEFARTLLETTLEKREVAMEYIKPKLKNWDPERIAVLDMLLMRMGVSEFLYFETIPPKVTINEYIDIAKEYSTPQSGQFVNGILDNIHKDLVRDNKMHKVAYGPS
jgi:N utilization substance protein B